LSFIIAAALKNPALYNMAIITGLFTDTTLVNQHLFSANHCLLQNLLPSHSAQAATQINSRNNLYSHAYNSRYIVFKYQAVFVKLFSFGTGPGF